MILIVKHVKRNNMEDFAFIYCFGDNDFGSNFERAGELYCDEFNQILENIDNSVNKLQRDFEIKNLERLKEKQNIINLLKFGFSSYYFEDFIISYLPIFVLAKYSQELLKISLFLT